QINAGGFLVPVGPAGTPGTMNVFGNLAFQSGAFYFVQVNPATASTTNVGGTAALAGTVVANFAPGNYLSRSYTILTAPGGLAAPPAALLPSGCLSRSGRHRTYPDNPAFLTRGPLCFPEGAPQPIPPIPGLPAIPGLPPVPEQPPAQPLPTFTVNQLNVGR